jgi:hypothetical protein
MGRLMMAEGLITARASAAVREAGQASTASPGWRKRWARAEADHDATPRRARLIGLVYVRVRLRHDRCVIGQVRRAVQWVH